MDDKYYYWDCTNDECKCKNNKVEKAYIEKFEKLGKRIHIYCANCGFGPGAIKMKTEKYSEFADKACECIKFEGSERRLPMRKTDTGMYINFKDDECDLKSFLDLGIYPDVYLKWVKRNKMPRNIDLEK